MVTRRGLLLCLDAPEQIGQLLLDGIKGVFRPSYLLEGGSISVDKYQVTLVRVEPQPVSTAKIARAEYRATFKVSPAPH